MAKKLEDEVATSFPEIEEIKNDLNSLKNNVVELTRHVKAVGSEQAHDATTRFIRGLSQFQETSKREIKREAEKIERHVQERPAQSLAVAFAVGLLASMFLGRKS